MAPKRDALFPEKSKMLSFLMLVLPHSGQRKPTYRSWRISILHTSIFYEIII